MRAPPRDEDHHRRSKYRKTLADYAYLIPYLEQLANDETARSRLLCFAIPASQRAENLVVVFPQHRRRQHRGAAFAIERNSRSHAVLVSPSLLRSAPTVSSLCSPTTGGGSTAVLRSPSKETGGRTVRISPMVLCWADTRIPRCLACGSSKASLVSYMGACGTS